MGRFTVAAAILAATLLAGQAGAVAIGDSITCQGLVCLGPSPATVGPGPEFGLSFGLAADFSDGLLTVTNTFDGASDFQGGFVAAFSDLTSPFTSATLLTSTVTGFTANDVRLIDGTLFIDYSNTTFDRDGGFTIALGAASDVPEPAGWAMMVAGFAAAGTALRRRPRVTLAKLPIAL